ncbi:Ig-like domain-containing protein [Leifsonia sp. L25]|uniref:Ig-like domain-containing protein n=1 Tax=Actinomycetes TaxID=1760 RepID=UPI003D698BCB
MIAAFALAVLTVIQGVDSGPAHASAAALACDQNTLYGVDNANQLEAINATTGATTSIASVAPANNGLGVAVNGTAAYGFDNSANSITKYDATTGTTSTATSVDPAGNQTAIRGAINPATGFYYYGGSGTSATIGAYDPATGTKIGEVGVLTGLPSGNGDFAFSTRGLLFVVAANEVLRVNATTIPTTAGTTSLSTSLVATLPTGTNSPGIAFSTDGYLYVSSGTNILKLDPASGALVDTIAISGGFSPTDLGSCNYANTLSAQASVDTRWRSTDQFGLSFTGGGIVSGNSATTSGTATGLQPAVAGAALTLPGTSYTVTQTAAVTTDLTNYSTTYSCVDVNTGTPVASGTGDTTTFTFPAAATAAGTDVVCTFTNTTSAAHASAANDTASTTAGGAALSVTAPGVLAGAGGTGLAASLATDPSHGTATVSSNGAYTYAPAAGFSGTDTFTYTATDSSGATSTGTVTITVTPTATDDTGTASSGVTLTVDAAQGVLANDHGTALTASPATNPAHGTLLLSSDGSYTFAAAPGYSGPDSFAYTATDASGQHATATVHLTVLPTALPDSYSAAAGTTLRVADPAVLGDDLGTGLTAALATGPADGTVALNANGSFAYVPAAGFTGTDSFTYTATDASGSHSTATVTLTVLTAGRSTDDTAIGTPGRPETIDPLANDTPTRGNAFDTSTLALVDPTTHSPVHQVRVANVGTWALAGAHVVFTPVTGFAGRASVGYQVTDTAGRTTTAAVTVTYPAAAPAAAQAPPAVARLADTGSDAPVGPIALGALLLAAAGAALLLARRRAMA